MKPLSVANLGAAWLRPRWLYRRLLDGLADVLKEVARWASASAARHMDRVSKLLSDLLAERMREETGSEAAVTRVLGRRPTRLTNEGESTHTETSYMSAARLADTNLLVYARDAGETEPCRSAPGQVRRGDLATGRGL